MLEAQEGSKEQAGQQESRVVACQDHGQHEDAVEEAIVLEVNVVDDQEPRGQQDGECSSVGSDFGLGRLHVAVVSLVKHAAGGGAG